MRPRKVRLYAAALAAGVLLAGACGRSAVAPSAPGGGASPSPSPVRTVLITGATFVVRAGGSSFTNIDFPPTGRVDVTVSWGGSGPIEFFVTDASCPGFDDVEAGRCAVLARAEGSARPKQAQFDSAAGRIYTVWTANRGTAPESVSLDAGVTTFGPPPPAPTPPPTTPTAPRPSPTPADLAPGPVTQLKAYIKTIETEQGSRVYRPGEQDQDGNWILHPGEFVVFDLTQRNGAGQICGWTEDPEWTVQDPEGVLRIRESSHPFFLRVNVERKGYFELQGSIDGIDSNVLRVNAVARGN